MNRYRIYVGNLSPNVSAEELKSKFLPFCTRVDRNVEIKCKNGDSYFAYVNVFADNEGVSENDKLPPASIRKCLDVLNNTNLNGCVIKVQLAKEDFLSRLKKEREGQNHGDKPAKTEKSGEPINDLQLTKPPLSLTQTHLKLLELASQPVPKSHNKVKPISDFNSKRLLQPPGPKLITNTGGIKFNAAKRLKSDQLRVESMNRKYSMTKQQTGLIQSSLQQLAGYPVDTVKASHVQDARQKNDSKMKLFEDEDMDDSTDFGIQDQYEGESGQKLLELKSKWNFDSRFKIDKRFAEGGDKAKANAKDDLSKEKSEQAAILNQMFGKEVVNHAPELDTRKSKKGKAQNKAVENSSVVTRFDPDLPSHRQQFERKKVEDVELNEPRKLSKKDKNKASKITEEPKIAVVPEKSVYKVASNLKQLFSGDSEATANNTQQFSLLATFGDKNVTEKASKKTRHTNGEINPDDKPRSFWQANPFHYDSSDDEADTKKNKKRKEESSYENQNKKVEKSKVQSNMTAKSCFFLNKKEDSFKQLNDFFLKSEENLEDVHAKFNQTGRAELKAIVRAKVKNSKRKDQKRRLEMARHARKRRMRYQKEVQKKHQEKREKQTQRQDRNNERSKSKA